MFSLIYLKTLDCNYKKERVFSDIYRICLFNENFDYDYFGDEYSNESDWKLLSDCKYV